MNSPQTLFGRPIVFGSLGLTKTEVAFGSLDDLSQEDCKRVLKNLEEQEADDEPAD